MDNEDEQTIEAPKHYYTLWLKNEQGKRIKELAKAEGSPFWTAIWQLAKEMYGEENIDYSFE